MVDITTGGLRDRVVRDAAASLITTGLAALGWYDTANVAKLHWVDAPLPPDEEVPPGTIFLSVENIPIVEDLELGGDLSEYRYIMYVDLYGWDEDSARQAIGDVRDILRGKFPSIGCIFPVLDVYDTTQDPVPSDPAFQLAIENVADDRVRNTTKAYQQYWFVVKFELVDER